MKCPSNQFYFVKSLTFGILISWGHSQSKLRMSRSNQERSDPIEASHPRRSCPDQTSLPGQSRL
ncbi:hypothetical protein CR513_16101, partial [Mucuna pruriens]